MPRKEELEIIIEKLIKEIRSKSNDTFFVSKMYEITGDIISLSDELRNYVNEYKAVKVNEKSN